MPKVYACSRQEAEDMEPSFWGKAYIISITDPPSLHSPEPTEANLRDGWHKILRLQFHDIEGAIDGFPQYIPMTEGQAKEIKAFIDEANAEYCPIIVHCEAGISRSQAVLMYILDHYKGYASFHPKPTYYNKYVYDCLLRISRDEN